LIPAASGSRRAALAARVAHGLGSAAPMFQSIVVGTDGSPTAGEAVRQAAEIARDLGARVHLVSAYEAEAVSVRGGGPERREWEIGPGITVDAVLEQAAGTIRVKGVEVETHARKGDPAEAILDVLQPSARSRPTASATAARDETPSLPKTRVM
jgi:hypothetical protein